ncbi:hypothetical protein [Christiangramia crocea]|uniref:Uncharacterized protein n=1 Tax=Christiangramia crocea TaxID=2904124 RepID=A0A9X1UVQ3_9FLAO|nr:hypothetical protein [Gramella crocea]MCG9971016.1 hypothetical protein [Gramella crocea]
MKLEQIIDRLCSHEITKTEAVSLIKEKVQEKGIEFEIEGISTTTPSGHYNLEITCYYGEYKCDNKFNKGDKLIIKPEL